MRHLYCAALFVAAMVWNPQESIAQKTDQAKVRLNIRPSYAIVYVDSVKLNPIPDSLVLDTGDHLLQVWAPKKKLLERNLTITSNQKQAIGASLSYSEAYKTYRKRKATYLTQKFFSRYFFLPATALTIAVATERIIALEDDMEKHFDLAQAARKNYQEGRTIRTIKPEEAEFRDHAERYQKALKARNDWVVGVSIAVPVGLLSYFLVKKTEILEKPVYRESPLLTQSELYLFPTSNGGQFGFCYHF